MSLMRILGQMQQNKYTFPKCLNGVYIRLTKTIDDNKVSVYFIMLLKTLDGNKVNV